MWTSIAATYGVRMILKLCSITTLSIRTQRYRYLDGSLKKMCSCPSKICRTYSSVQVKIVYNKFTEMPGINVYKLIDDEINKLKQSRTKLAKRALKHEIADL